MSEQSTWNVSGMTCGHCEMSVREEIGEISGVTAVEASHESGRVVVTSDGPLDPAAVAAAVEEAGYRLA